MRGEIDALLQLLEDDSPTVLAAVCQRLRDLGDDAAPALRFASEEGDPKVRARAREVLANIERRQPFERLIRFAASAEPDLEEGVMLLAAVRSPNVSPIALREQLDAIAERTARAMGTVGPGRGRIERFLRHLHGEERFAGDTDRFYAYHNNFIDSVLQRRRGIPITLIVVYILIARRLEIDVRAVGTPYKALAFYRDPIFSTYIDAFGGGKLLSYHECSESLLKAGFGSNTWKDFLRPATDRQIMERMVRNLVNFCASQGRDLDGRDFTRLALALSNNRERDRDDPDARSSHDSN